MPGTDCMERFERQVATVGQPDGTTAVNGAAGPAKRQPQIGFFHCGKVAADVDGTMLAAGRKIFELEIGNARKHGYHQVATVGQPDGATAVNGAAGSAKRQPQTFANHRWVRDLTE